MYTRAYILCSARRKSFPCLADRGLMPTFQGYRKQLSPLQMQIYDLLQTGIRKQLAEINVPACPDEGLKEIFESVVLDDPEIFYTSGFRSLRRTKSSSLTVMPCYTYSAKEIKTLTARCRQSALSLLKNAPVTDYERELFVHDQLLAVTYGDGHKKEAHSILGPLLENIGVCEGIAKTAKLLFDLLGMKSLVAVGVAKTPVGQKDELHGWNFVNIAGDWYQLDITFDNSLSKERPRYDYFNLSDEEAELDHKVTKECWVKCVVPQNGYYYQQGLIVETKEQLQARLRQSTDVVVKFPLTVKAEEAYRTVIAAVNELPRQPITISGNRQQAVYHFKKENA